MKSWSASRAILVDRSGVNAPSAAPTCRDEATEAVVKRGASTAAFSLVELLVVIAVIAVIAAMTIPTISGVLERADEAKTLKNAKEIAGMSSSLSSIGVAHVLPESLGGVKATARMLSVGVVVPEGPMQGQRFQLSGLTDEEIDKAEPYLDISYNEEELALSFIGKP
ncbi:MAG: prepilin-type N-terminal cleavage/methylation domain-containing protein [Verrucomicrobiales bacterium]|jgi:prepilin-type N-terminal cleavage/methylation domain-containing protein